MNCVLGRFGGVYFCWHRFLCTADERGTGCPTRHLLSAHRLCVWLQGGGWHIATPLTGGTGGTTSALTSASHNPKILGEAGQATCTSF